MSGSEQQAIPGEVVTSAELSQQEEHPVSVSDRLSLLAFYQLAGHMAGQNFVKVVMERATGKLHFISHAHYAFHADFIAERLMGTSKEEVHGGIDAFNKLVYLSAERPYFLGILAIHKKDGEGFFTLETVEIDNMGREMMSAFFAGVRAQVDPTLPLFFKPANHLQEETVRGLDPQALPRLFNHELYATKDFVALNAGEAVGRLRSFTTEEYQQSAATLKWYDIICMDRVPDDIPRVAGIINSNHTTPLSHTNVLACGWGIPNAVQLGMLGRARAEGLSGQWVRYVVDSDAEAVALTPVAAPVLPPEQPAWSLNRIRIEAPETNDTPIVPLSELRMTDRFRYGTKAANLGELRHVIDHGSPRLLGYYRIPRPPRANLLPYLAQAIGAPGLERDAAALAERTWAYLRRSMDVPRGIALPFSLQQEFLQSSWKIQQTIGKLKMALELGAKEAEALCVELQRVMRATRMGDALRDKIDAQIATHLAGVRSFVVRSSSNAEDLQGFSAAGIYESINHVTTADLIFDSVREVWVSLISPRSVRLRQDVGISLDDSYMGVIIQEEVAADLGGVLVTTNPMEPTKDFRNVYINASERSATEVVSGKSLPYQYLYNTVEGGGRTVALGGSGAELRPQQRQIMQTLAICGRLLQSHFSQDYAFSMPVDIEWAALGDKLSILQLRPYAV